MTGAEKAQTNSKERLIVGAREIMIERNGVDFSLHDIAMRTGLNSALVKYHFGNKDGLLLALLEQDAQKALAQVARLVARDISATEKLSAHISGIIDTYFRKPYMNRLVHLLMHERGDDAARQVMRFFIEPLAQHQRAILEQGVASGAFRPVDPGFFYHAVGSACDALFTWHPETRRLWGVKTLSDGTRRRYANFVIDLVLGGLALRA